MNKIMETIKRILRSRSMKYGSNSVILIAVVVAIAVLVNVIVGMLSLKLDLTANKLYSIGDATKDILKKMAKDVTIYGLFDEGKIGSSEELKEVTELLNQYSKYSHIKLKYIDPDKNPTIIKQLDPEGLKGIANDDFVFQSGTKIKRISYYQLFDVQSTEQGSAYKNASKAEQSFTGAIKYVTADKTPTVYFTEGHGEKAVSSEYKNVESYLSRNTFDVKTVNLLTAQKIPEDMEILIVISPEKDLAVQERETIKEYLKNGGKAVFLFDSLDSNPTFTEFENLLRDYNVSLGYDRVRENDDGRHPPNEAYDILPELQQNEINARLDPSSFAMIMPRARSINILRNPKERLEVTSLIRTSDRAVGEQIDPSRGQDTAGPLDLAVAVEDTNGLKPTKILVIGNAKFVNDNEIQKYQQYSVAGMYFFLNSLIWLQDKQEETIVAPKAYASQQLKINETQANIMALATVVVLPLLVLGAGIFVWLRRRHL